MTRPSRYELLRSIVPKRTGLAWRTLSLFMLAVGITSCSGQQSTSGPLPELHLPGVTRLSAVDKMLHDVFILEKDTLHLMTTYVAPDGNERVLFVAGATLYDIGIDGGDAHTVPLASPCTGRPSVDTHGAFMLCQTAEGITQVALNQAPPDRGHILLSNHADSQLAHDDILTHPTWAPDGVHFAVVSREGDCSIGMYELPSPQARPLLRARLVFADFKTAPTAQGLPGCLITDLAWSPDGQWLALNAEFYPSTPLYVLSLAQLHLSLSSSTIPAVAVALSRTDLQEVAQNSAVFAWPAEAQRLTIVSQGQDIEQVTFSDSQQYVLIAQQIAFICALSWTPDGHRLVFVLCHPTSNLHVLGPAAQVYVFTP